MGLPPGKVVVPLRQKGPSPIKLGPLLQLLQQYPVVQDRAYLGEGFQRGFRIPYQGPRVSSWAKNLRSVKGLEQVVRAKIDKEVQEGRVLGPFPHPPLPSFRVSPLGVVPKKAKGEYRLIHHLSFPAGGSVNDAIPHQLCSVKYTTFEAAVEMVREQGKGALMGKCDIKSAFRLLPVHPDDFDLLGFSFEGSYYIDRALPMGCSISCSAFERFSSFLEWAVRERAGLTSVVHYLDDFLFCCPGPLSTCKYLMDTFHELAKELGVPLAPEKTEGPTTRLAFLGIEIDTVAQCCRLPPEKVLALEQRLRQLLDARKVTLRDLQVIVGHLNFACRVIAPGRAFLRRLCDATKGLRAPHHRVRVTHELREDARMWVEFLRDFNGISLWRSKFLLEAELQIQSDAAGGHGFGLFFRGRWCASRWPPAWIEMGVTRDMTFLEFFPIVVAVHIWARDFEDRAVQFWCDNMATVQVINSGTSRSPRVMRLVRCFTLQCLRHNILFAARHVPGLDNSIADALSRMQEERFRTLAPAARELPEVFPPHLWNLGF
ncbi:uncharacterized protein LOC128324664 isoform X1 [Hemicordylus capensis]|uniref:uncharacterized protein LOC128324664 isoform X1 n=1 Tax=Hemicordylus capensis TaxID=884348 RepID=UPI00230289B1|nr:uncharacterized protein LOC128324664 isoform X1 [Hemicordylus capensis]